MIRTYKLEYESPIGVIEIIGTDKAIISILFSEEKKSETVLDETPPVLTECCNELEEYFKGERQKFSFPIQFKGTDFQESVWKALESISFAETGSYRDIAKYIGNEKASRAVGNANGKNKLSIVIPCHRIIGSNERLTGYAGGLWRKEWLLDHERHIARQKSHDWA